jgi:transmembrane sensor
LVDADGTTIRAIGTAFGVERQVQGVVVTVAEGKVGVFASNTSSQANQASTSKTNETGLEHQRGPYDSPRPAVILTADQQVMVSRSGIAEAVHNVNSERELAWAKGQLVLDNETIAAAVEEFNRYNRLQLRLANEDVARRSVSGIFNASDPESFIEFLQTVIPVRVTRGESEIIVR